MTFKYLALSAAILLSTMSTASNADSFEPKAVSAGVEYRIKFGGSTRAKPQAPTFGFNVNVTRAQNGPAFDFAPLTLSYTENKYNKLLDVRFNANTKALYSMHVNGVDVLYDAARLNLDPADVALKQSTGAVGINAVNWPLAATAVFGFVIVDNMAQDDAKNRKNAQAATKVPDASCLPFMLSAVSEIAVKACKSAD
ncbi:MAG: hypothetical protein RL392_497 [Pseudomonadota bacterium]|jgi:hypothetical protein